MDFRNIFGQAAVTNVFFLFLHGHAYYSESASDDDRAVHYYMYTPERERYALKYQLELSYIDTLEAFLTFNNDYARKLCKARDLAKRMQKKKSRSLSCHMLRDR
eukprot:g9653.t1